MRRLAAKRPQSDMDEPSEPGRSKRYCSESQSEDDDDFRYFYEPVSNIDIPGDLGLIVYLLRNVTIAGLEVGYAVLYDSDMGDSDLNGVNAPHASSARRGVQRFKGRTTLSKEAPLAAVLSTGGTT